MRDQAQFKALVQERMNQQRQAHILRRQKRQSLLISCSMLVVLIGVISLLLRSSVLTSSPFSLLSTPENTPQQNGCSGQSLKDHSSPTTEKTDADAESSPVPDESPSKQDPTSQKPSGENVTGSTMDLFSQDDAHNDAGDCTQTSGMENSDLVPTDADKIIVQTTVQTEGSISLEINTQEGIRQYCDLIESLAAEAGPSPGTARTTRATIDFYKNERVFYKILITGNLHMIRYGSTTDEVKLTGAQYKQLLNFVP